jgi:hypothetical protein
MKTKVLPLRAALIMLFAVAMLIATACEQTAGGGDLSSDPLDPRFIGRWRSVSKEDGEGYNISETLFEYQDGGQPKGVWGMSYKGVVRYTKRFNKTDGIIIVEYTSDGWPEYTKPGHNINPWVGTPIPGPFFGIYYSKLTDNSVVLANATTLDSVPLYKPPETKTLAEAITKFTLKNRDRFVANVAMPQQRWDN